MSQPIQLVRDFVFINHLERKLRRKLTEEETYGLVPVKYLTDDGVQVEERVPLYPLKFFVTEVPDL